MVPGFCLRPVEYQLTEEFRGDGQTHALDDSQHVIEGKVCLEQGAQLEPHTTWQPLGSSVIGIHQELCPPSSQSFSNDDYINTTRAVPDHAPGSCFPFRTTRDQVIADNRRMILEKQQTD